MSYLQKLAERFEMQREFTESYAPLYSGIFGTLALWCRHPEAAADPLVNWLLAAAEGRQPFDVPLLLLAGLHREVLAQTEEVAELARYYPTATGDLVGQHPTAPFPEVLRQAILARQDTLRPFIQTALVQTNETGRGYCWLLPLVQTGWQAAHLVDLGASAGLNLVAEQRHFRFESAEDGRHLLDLGSGDPVQFRIAVSGEAAVLEGLATRPLPAILSRTGCDLAPFVLGTPEAELTLMAYVWADQPQRLERLREGLAALRRVAQTESAVALHPVRLPHELPLFLPHLPAGGQPTVLYNTYITQYFKREAAELRQHIAEWAAARPSPVLWLQWEPFWDERQAAAAGFGWCSWTADLWRGEEHHSWLLGWVHPHGTALQLVPEAKDFQQFWHT